MSRPNNTVVLTGRITKDPEVKEVSNDNAVIRFTLAVDDGTINGEKQTQFITCVAWNGVADVIGKYVKKGDMVNITGSLQENNYEKDDVMHYTLQVLCSSVYLLPNGREEKPQKSSAKKYSRKG